MFRITYKWISFDSCIVRPTNFWFGGCSRIRSAIVFIIYKYYNVYIYLNKQIQFTWINIFPGTDVFVNAEQNRFNKPLFFEKQIKIK